MQNPISLQRQVYGDRHRLQDNLIMLQEQNVALRFI